MGTDHGLGIEVIKDRLADLCQVVIQVLTEIHDKDDSLFVHRDDHLCLGIREKILQDLKAFHAIVLADTHDEYDTAGRKRDLILSGLQRNIAGQFVFEKYILDKGLALDIRVSLTHGSLDPLGDQFKISSCDGIDSADEGDILGGITDHDLHVGLAGRAGKKFVRKKYGSGTGILDTFPCRIGAGNDHTRCIHDADRQVKDLLRFAHTFLKFFHTLHLISFVKYSSQGLFALIHYTILFILNFS